MSVKIEVTMPGIIPGAAYASGQITVARSASYAGGGFHGEVVIYNKYTWQCVNGVPAYTVDSGSGNQWSPVVGPGGVSIGRLFLTFTPDQPKNPDAKAELKLYTGDGGEVSAGVVVLATSYAVQCTAV